MKRYVMHVDPAIDDRESMEQWVDDVLPMSASNAWSIEVSGAWQPSAGMANPSLLRLGCASLASRLIGQGSDRTNALRRLHAAFDLAAEKGTDNLDRVAASVVLLVYASAVVAALRARGIDSLVLSRVERNEQHTPTFVATKRVHVLPLGSGRLTTTVAEV